MSTHPAHRVHWASIACFYVLACAISWPFFWWQRTAPESWNAWGVPALLKGLTYMWGPGLAALAMVLLFRRSGARRITFSGGRFGPAQAFYWVPIVGLALSREWTHAEGFRFLGYGALGLLMTLGEELGWRGWLQDALRPLPPMRRFLLIALLWELWHARLFIGRPPPPVGLALMVVMVLVLTFVLGWATERTSSVMVAATLHAWVNISFEYPGWGTWAVLGAAIPFWAAMLFRWPRSQLDVDPPATVAPDTLSSRSSAVSTDQIP